MKIFFECGSVANRQRTIRPHPKTLRWSYCYCQRQCCRKSKCVVSPQISGVKCAWNDSIKAQYKIQLFQKLLPTNKPHLLQYGNAMQKWAGFLEQNFDDAWSSFHPSLVVSINKIAEFGNTKHHSTIKKSHCFGRSVLKNHHWTIFLQNLEQPSTAHIIIEFWHNLCLCKCVKKVWRTSISNKAAQLTTP